MSTEAAAAAKPDPKLARAAINLPKFGLLLAQLVALLVVIWQFNVWSGDFIRVAMVGVGAFVLMYFTPFAMKKQVFLLLSLAGGAALLAFKGGSTTPVAIAASGLIVGTAVVLGSLFYVILRLPLPYWWRVAIVLVLTALFYWDRNQYYILPSNGWAIFGAIFMFRLIIYCYEVKIARAPEKYLDFLNYFFLLPNFIFLLFPIIDYATFKKTWFVSDIHKTAQRGIDWMVRGVVHLILYRILYHNLPIAPDEVQSFPTLLQYIFPTFLLYLQVSGQFHFIIGLLHLYGWQLPETNRRYLLASSFTDFWRRINIYWKDFMVKCFYYPAYFRLRKKNETLALIVATIFVFAVTTALHGWQHYWLSGHFIVTTGDGIFWTALGVLVLTNVLIESNRKPMLKKPQGAGPKIKRVLATLGVYITISILWSAWSATSLADWWTAITYWR